MRTFVFFIGMLLLFVLSGCDRSPEFSGDGGALCNEESECCADGRSANEGQECDADNLCTNNTCLKGFCMAGPPKDCGGSATCVPLTGECCSGCGLGGQCYLDGALQNDNVCLICDGGTHDFVSNDGVTCEGSDPCMLGDICEAGICKEGEEPKCKDDGIFCNGVETCDFGVCNEPVNTCDAPMVCNTAVSPGSCDASCGANQCTINNTCYNAGTTKLGSACMQCDPVVSKNSWTPKNEICSDGLSCTTDVCIGGAVIDCQSEVDAGKCRIKTSDVDECFDSGDSNPMNPCQACNHSTSSANWSINEGAACDNSVFCDGDDTCNSTGICTTAGIDPCMSGDICSNTCNETSRTCYSSTTQACDDDNSQTVEDFCSGTGSCVGTPYCELAQCWLVLPTGYELTQCYNGTSEVDCNILGGQLDFEAGCSSTCEDYCGQDGQYPDDIVSGERFSNNGSEVMDKHTGLIWQLQEGTDKNWDQATAYCAGQWRLPTVHELASLTKYGGCIPASEFPGMTSSNDGDYWSSSYVGAVTLAWTVNFTHGEMQTVSKASSFSVRCVRGGASFIADPPEQYSIVESGGDTVIVDRMTGLEWEAPDDRELDWKDALNECEQLSFANRNDWRLPNVNELQSLVDYTQHSPALHSDIAEYFQSAIYWSSSPDVWYLNFAWYVSFAAGSVRSDATWLWMYPVVCVRGGV